MAPKNAVVESAAKSKKGKLDGKIANQARESNTRKQPTRGAKSKVVKPSPKASQKKSATNKKIEANLNIKKEVGDSPQANPTTSLPAKTTEELPHNLGLPTPTTSSPQDQNTDDQKITVTKEEPFQNPALIPIEPTTTTPQTPTSISETPNLKAKEKPRTKYKFNPGVTPFPTWPAPTPTQCEEINHLLSYTHGEPTPPQTIPPPSIEFAGCGEVPCVLDALIRTLLSAATQGSNSAMSYKALATRFGVLETGVGKGGVNWEAVRLAPLREVFDTIQRGGLADVKSKNLKAILDLVYEENRARFEVLREDRKRKDENKASLADAEDGAKETATTNETEPQEKLVQEKEIDYELACAEENYLTLNHLHTLPTDQAMSELIKYPGIGVKTAACVLLFCLQRPCFAVDTHIFRITKWLGWVPADLATEVTAFSHLDARIPDHLKYSLHHLLIKHGKSCPRCRAATGEGSEEWALGCPIEEFVTRTGKRKGGPEIVSRGRRGRGKAVKKVVAKKGKGNGNGKEKEKEKGKRAVKKKVVGKE